MPSLRLPHGPLQYLGRCPFNYSAGAAHSTPPRLSFPRFQGCFRGCACGTNPHGLVPDNYLVRGTSNIPSTSPFTPALCMCHHELPALDRAAGVRRSTNPAARRRRGVATTSKPTPGRARGMTIPPTGALPPPPRARWQASQRLVSTAPAGAMQRIRRRHATLRLRLAAAGP